MRIDVSWEVENDAWGTTHYDVELEVRLGARERLRCHPDDAAPGDGDEAEVLWVRTAAGTALRRDQWEDHGFNTHELEAVKLRAIADAKETGTESRKEEEWY